MSISREGMALASWTWMVVQAAKRDGQFSRFQYTPARAANQKRRLYEQSDAFRDVYRWRAGIEATMSRLKVPDEPGSPTHSRHAGHALRGQSACPRPQYPTLRGNRTIKNEAKEKPRVGNIRFYPPATRRQANILHRTAKTCTSTPSANNFLPPRPLSAIARVNTANSTRCASRWSPISATKPSPRGFPRSRRKRGLAGMEHERHAAQCGDTTGSGLLITQSARSSADYSLS